MLTSPVPANTKAVIAAMATLTDALHACTSKELMRVPFELHEQMQSTLQHIDDVNGAIKASPADAERLRQKRNTYVADLVTLQRFFRDMPNLEKLHKVKASALTTDDAPIMALVEHSRDDIQRAGLLLNGMLKTLYMSMED